MSDIAKSLIILGAILLGAGVLLSFAGKIPGLGRLPGDITVRRGDFTFYFPLATSLLISLILTLFFNLFWKR